MRATFSAGIKDYLPTIAYTVNTGWERVIPKEMTAIVEGLQNVLFPKLNEIITKLDDVHDDIKTIKERQDLYEQLHALRLEVDVLKENQASSSALGS